MTTLPPLKMKKKKRQKGKGKKALADVLEWKEREERFSVQSLDRP